MKERSFSYIRHTENSLCVINNWFIGSKHMVLNLNKRILERIIYYNYLKL